MSKRPAGSQKGTPPKKRKLAIRDDVLHLTEPHPNYNADITKILLRECIQCINVNKSEVGEIEKNTGFPHKAKAYNIASASLASYPTRIPSGDAAKSKIF